LEKEFHRRLDEMKVKPVVATISPEGYLTSKYYWRDFNVVLCNDPCKSVSREKYVVWLWHSFPLPNEEPLKPMLEKQLDRGKIIYAGKMPGIMAALVTYNDWNMGKGDNKVYSK